MTKYTSIMSIHARRRIQQRGIRVAVLDLVIANADVALHAGNGCETIRLSREAACDLVGSGDVDPEDAARACRVAVLIGRRGLVTALHPSKGRRGRCYRRQDKTRAAHLGRPRR